VGAVTRVVAARRLPDLEHLLRVTMVVTGPAVASVWR